MCNKTAKLSGVDYTSIEDVENLYDDLTSWDKSEFIKSHLGDTTVEAEDVSDEEVVYYHDDVYEFVNDHDTGILLDKIGMSDVMDYVRDQYSLEDFLDFLTSQGRSWRSGYTAREIITELMSGDFTLDEEKYEDVKPILDEINTDVLREYIAKTFNVDI